MVKELISGKIKNIRTLHKLSQEEFAEKLEVSRQTVYYWESGKAVPDYNKIVLLCKEFNLSPNEFFYDDVCVCACTADEIEAAGSESNQESNTDAKSKLIVKKRIIASVLLIVGIVTLLSSFLGIMYADVVHNGLATVSINSFNMTPSNIVAVICSIIGVALVVWSAVLYARGDKNIK